MLFKKSFEKKDSFLSILPFFISRVIILMTFSFDICVKSTCKKILTVLIFH